ncbi:AsmA-like C-terminal region [Desulfurella multipotens]|uniref:AsmA-like C-terminal region n=1 Tax=Desulfurella multipotens TaxID=79269 RepID=A0A1G6HTE1_9BACT|nr:AsmA-like C-terminal region-containing protein [Desulfurella multipotens]SDB97454.1 AsmA-like C-terminal region [Desulfurella multipotens]
MKKKLLIAFIILITFIVLILAGYFSLPFFLKSQYFLHLVENKTHIKIDKIENYKISQTLTTINVNISQLEVSSSKFKANAKNLSYKLKLSELISKKPTFGNLKIHQLNLVAYRSKIPAKTKTIIKPLPLSIEIQHLSASYENYKIEGKLDLILNLPTKNNNFYFEGNVNNSPTTLSGDINPSNLHVSLNIKKFSPQNFPAYLKAIDNSSAKATLTLKNNLELQSGNLKISDINYKGLKLNNPSASYSKDELFVNIPYLTYKQNISGKSVKLKLNTKNYNGSVDLSNINIANLNIEKPTINFKYNKNTHAFFIDTLSKNGYFINAKGTLNTKNLEESTIAGFFKTPYIDYNQIKPLLPKHIQEYIYSGQIKAEKVTFKGKIKDKENLIDTGELVAQSTRFIVEKNTYPFTITFANIQITPKDVVIHGTGYCDKVNLISSKLVIARKKGYPADMHLVLNGESTKNTEDFLYKAILSHEDAKYIDYAKDIRGPFTAIIDIKNYYWHSLPHFYFNVNIDSNLSLQDKKISQKPINLIGKFDIQRNNQILRVSANNLKLATDNSFINITGYLEHSNTVFYKATIRAKINPVEIRDISYLKPYKNYLPTSEVTIKPSSISGNLKKINFDVNIEGKKLFKEHGFGVDEILAKGYYEKNLISFNPVKLDDTLSINGLYNTKAKSFNGNINLKNFKISTIKNLVKLPIDEAILNGSVKLGLEDKKLQYIYSNNLVVSDLVYGNDVVVKSAHVSFNKNYATIENGNALIMQNPVSFTGNVNLEPLVINLNAKSQKFIIKKTKSKTKSYIGDIKFKIPKVSIYAQADIDELIIEDSKPLVFNNVNAHLELASKRYISLKAPYTSIYIDMAQNTINVEATDSYIFAHYIESKTKKPSITTLKATLNTPSTDEIDLKKLNGTIKFVSENGNIKNFPDIYKILTLADVVGLLTGQFDTKKGFYYTKTVGIFDLKDGILKTQKPLTVKGTANNLFINGNVNLTNYHVDALFMITTFTFLNRLISSIPIIGHILGGKEKSFTGLSFRVDGYLDGKMNLYPVPWESLGKGLLDIITRTITLPAYLLGVNGNTNNTEKKK